PAGQIGRDRPDAGCNGRAATRHRPFKMKGHMKRLLLLCLLLPLTLASSPGAETKGWRAATAAELEAALPARAPVEKERIETEMRTASGIINARGELIGGVVLITAGYSADGKYSHYVLAQ